jgi:site-specific recombinase XerD
MPATTAHEPLDDLLASFELSLRARKRSPRTVSNYLASARLLDDWLAGRKPRRHVLDATRADIQGFTASQLERHSPSTAATRFRCVQQLYRWAVDEELIESSPMDGLTPPAIDEKVVPVLTDPQLRALVKACEGKAFDDLRDRAIVLFMVDSGSRLAETIGLELGDVDAKAQTAVVHGKGDWSRRVYFSATTAVALDRYLRQRKAHAWGRSPKLWVGVRGPLTDSGLTQMLRRRAKLAGIGHVHPHQLRHTWSHLMKVGGMSDDELMALGGWRSPQMLSRYGSSARAERAKATYERMAPGDRL